ncbi:MAG TPA: ATP-binding protein [Gemmatimonadaceae bacterium]|nr:ATP-binding protein [Gemmatimonadaceae bacterium]
MSHAPHWEPHAEIAAWSSRVDEVRRRSDEVPSETLLAVAFEELTVAEEELRVQEQQLVEANEALATERNRYLALFEHAPVPYFLTDPAGVIRQANAATSALLHVAPKHLKGKPLASFVPAAERGAFRRELLRIAAADDTASVELRLKPRRGEPRFVSATIGISRDAAAGPELRWLLVDETPRRQREREAAARAAAEESDRAKTELLATVSHELRTPLTSVGGYAGILLMGVHGPLNERQAVDVDRIRRAQSHASRLLDDLLDYFRAKRGHLEVELAAVPVADAVASAQAMVRPLADAKRLTLRALPAPQGLTARADGERLRQVVINLLSNAVKFTSEGGAVEVRVAADGSDVVIQVRDTGIGIPADRLEDLFKPFVRVAASDQPGVGLGLAISRELARAMNGSLAADSVQGEGSTFTLRVPAARD